MMKPLHVIARMTEPVVYYGDGMHLDGILAYAAYMDLSVDERSELPPIGSAWAEDFQLPLATWAVESIVPGHVDSRLFELFNEAEQLDDGHKRGSVWGWHASAVHADWLCHDRFAVRRRPEVEQIQRYTVSPSVNLGAGQLKAINKVLPARFATELHWWALGDEEETRKLLTSHVRAVGKITNKGPGAVADWGVEVVDEDWSIEKHGRLTRVMPIGYTGAQGDAAEASIRPPYHHASRIIPAMLPSFPNLEVTGAIA